MPLYQPANGWDAAIKLAVSGESVFTDASEMFNVGFEENHNTERRKQLGTKSPAYMPGRYEATGRATGYFITGAMAARLFTVPDKTALNRDHATRGITQFNLEIDFSNFPITVNAALAGPLAAPTGSVAGTGGSLAAGVKSYRVAAITAAGETAVSPAFSITTSGSTSVVTLNWSAFTGATGYKLYGRTAGAEKLMQTLGAVTTATDDGSVTTPVGDYKADINLVGYLLSGCLLDTHTFDIAEGAYIEQPLTFKVQRVIDVYQGDSPSDLTPYIV